MAQINADTGKHRSIRQPYGWKQPKKPLVAAGPTMTIRVPKGRAGKTIKVPHPGDKNVLFTVNIPRNAREGQEMLVPVPNVEEARAAMQAQQAAGGGGGGGGGGGRVNDNGSPVKVGRDGKTFYCGNS